MEPTRTHSAPLAALMLASLLPACEDTSPTADVTCDEVAAHVVELQARAVPDALGAEARAAYREALAAESGAPLAVACDDLSLEARACAVGAESMGALAKCGVRSSAGVVPELEYSRAGLGVAGPGAPPPLPLPGGPAIDSQSSEVAR